MRKDKGRASHLLNYIGHGESLSRTGHAEQCLMGGPPVQTCHKFGDGLRLVAGGLIFRSKLKIHKKRCRMRMARRVSNKVTKNPSNVAPPLCEKTLCGGRSGPPMCHISQRNKTGIPDFSNNMSP